MSVDQKIEKDKAVRAPASVQPALPLEKKKREPTRRETVEAEVVEQPHTHIADDQPLEPSKSLAIADFSAPLGNPLEAFMRFAYGLGVPGSVLASPFRKPAKPRLLGTPQSPLAGERAAGVALRAGHFLVHGLKAPLSQVDMESSARLTPPFQRTIHGFTWLPDLAGCAPREQCVPVAQRILTRWLDANPQPAKGQAWSVENTGRRLLNWMVHAPLLLSGEDEALRLRTLGAMEDTARWLDRHVKSADDELGALAGWCGIVAAGLLLPDGRARLLFGEAGLIRALGDLASEDGGVLSRSPLAQMDAIALLIDLTACYAAMDRDPPQAVDTMMALLVPPLLALRHGDGGLGSWQGAGAVSAAQVSALIDASNIRARPGKDMRQWGYQRIGARKTVLQFDAAPPPRSKHARFGCASTLAFELSSGAHRIIVNCGGAEYAGGLTPVRIEQGLRATAAHSTLTLDDANSTAILIKGQIGKGVEEVDIARATIRQRDIGAVKLEASHDGYASRYGLLHRRILILRDDGEELRGEDLLVPQGKKGKRGKIGFAIRFHLGPGVEAGLSDDKRGVGLALPDGSYWQMRLGSDADDGEIEIEESLWIDAQGKPRPTQQIVICGLTSRGGGRFPWLLKKMG
ncbi:heparinase II/III family protein [Qipengyuania atrilutea]|uniref:Heparinase II/III family protein n=1 Tax=Qipengyuania atrilutea TaxID=2744473 RepID=A0A850H1Z1_9SPHN|nr:heparinase II/III family protein [Actirhodobacter atriluteus]NVD44560.1 heparinase II/III family protein [Actirhodobacter atriluteus]